MTVIGFTSCISAAANLMTCINTISIHTSFAWCTIIVRAATNCKKQKKQKYLFFLYPFYLNFNNKKKTKTYFRSKHIEHFRWILHGKHIMVCGLEHDKQHFLRKYFFLGTDFCIFHLYKLCHCYSRNQIHIPVELELVHLLANYIERMVNRNSLVDTNKSVDDWSYYKLHSDHKH